MNLIFFYFLEYFIFDDFILMIKIYMVVGEIINMFCNVIGSFFFSILFKK